MLDESAQVPEGKRGDEGIKALLRLAKYCEETTVLLVATERLWLTLKCEFQAATTIPQADAYKALAAAMSELN